MRFIQKTFKSNLEKKLRIKVFIFIIISVRKVSLEPSLCTLLEPPDPAPLGEPELDDPDDSISSSFAISKADTSSNTLLLPTERIVEGAEMDDDERPEDCKCIIMKYFSRDR